MYRGKKAELVTPSVTQELAMMRQASEEDDRDLAGYFYDEDDWGDPDDFDNEILNSPHRPQYPEFIGNYDDGL